MAHLVQQVLPLGRPVSSSWIDSPTTRNYAPPGRASTRHGLQSPLCFNPFYGPLDKAHVAFLTASLAEMASGGVEP